ncbi:hypothetical protein V5799_003192 [Amblyomma americanum]|uniref:Uncharacterized protein n=1 Tax=Amblyomma americanum TaxID=6943 RepID=A0AAQ4D9N7_AMBAM
MDEEIISAMKTEDIDESSFELEVTAEAAGTYVAAEDPAPARQPHLRSAANTSAVLAGTCRQQRKRPITAAQETQKFLLEEQRVLRQDLSKRIENKRAPAP